MNSFVNVRTLGETTTRGLTSPCHDISHAVATTSLEYDLTSPGDEAGFRAPGHA
jgi:hypothetical protein